MQDLVDLQKSYVKILVILKITFVELVSKCKSFNIQHDFEKENKYKTCTTEKMTFLELLAC